MPDHSVIVTCHYKKVDHFKFDLPYYLTSHIVSTNKFWANHGLTSTTVLKSVPDTEYAYTILLKFKDLAGWEAAQRDENTKQLLEDVGNFTNPTPLFIVGKVVT